MKGEEGNHRKPGTNLIQPNTYEKKGENYEKLKTI